MGTKSLSFNLSDETPGGQAKSFPGEPDAELAIGFLGAGRMATALAKGWLRAGLVRADACRASDPLSQVRQAFTAETGCPGVADNREVIAADDLLMLAVKPQSMATRSS